MNVQIFIAAVWTIMALPFIWILIKDPRSLKSGLFFVIFLAGTAFLILMELFACSEVLMSNQLAANILVILALIIIFILMLFPFMLIIFLFVEGIRLVRREGFTWTNLLTLGLAVFLVLYQFVLPSTLIGRKSFGWFDLIWMPFSIVAAYFLTIFAIFCLSALINLIHIRKAKNLKQIVVLGSGLINGKVTPLLAGRIEKGIELLKQNPDAVLILSGGQGSDEPMAESEAMAVWAIEHGADPGRIIMEKQSVNTRENLIYSSALFKEAPTRYNTAVVSTGYHVFRALMLARNLGIDCSGYGSRTKWYFAMNAIIREYVGYLSLTWKTQLKIIALLLSPWLILGLILFIFT